MITTGIRMGCRRRRGGGRRGGGIVSVEPGLFVPSLACGRRLDVELTNAAFKLRKCGGHCWRGDGCSGIVGGSGVRRGRWGCAAPFVLGGVAVNFGSFSTLSAKGRADWGEPVWVLVCVPDGF